MTREPELNERGHRVDVAFDRRVILKLSFANRARVASADGVDKDEVGLQQCRRIVGLKPIRAGPWVLGIVEGNTHRSHRAEVQPKTMRQTAVEQNVTGAGAR